MAIHNVAPPGTKPELATPPNAPIARDGGILIYDATVDDTIAVPNNATEEVTQAYQDGLPAQEFWLEDPATHKIEVKLNSKGLVDDKALIADVQSTIHPDFIWAGRADRHHLYWPRADYVTMQQTSESKAYAFREVGTNVIRVQRVFHNWIHAITLPPPMPEPEVMQYSLETWEIMGNFYKAVRQTVNHQRKFAREEQRRISGYSEQGKELVRTSLSRELSGVIMHLEALENVPEEYWPFRRDAKVRFAAGRVGQVIKDGYMNRTREVRLANVA